MIPLVLTLQIGLPLALLVWLALAANSVDGFLLKALGVGAFLLALALVAQWAVVPWWLPRVYGVLWAAAVIYHVARGRWAQVRALPSGWWRWAEATAGAMLLGAGVWFTGAAIEARSPPQAAAVDIANPFGPGDYLVGSGGGRQLLNAHMRTLDPSVPRYRAWRGQSYALDFFGLNKLGTRSRGLSPKDPAAYAIFGAALHSPCNGEVLATKSTKPDLQVPMQDTVNRLGNHVILDCGDAQIVLAHMRRGSVTVEPGETVTLGRRLGSVGNSGASTEPHLHIHAQRAPAPGEAPISGDPLPLRIDGKFLVRGDRLEGQTWNRRSE